MDLFPLARRVLLTAYADTDAAIEAINVVDLDHYLLKPWDPPEEKLYPVVDALLDAWSSTPDRPVTDIRLVGHRWSAQSYALRDFLARNMVPYRWYLADEPEGARLLEAADVPAEDVPLVITADGTCLVRPSEAELAGHVGLSTAPASDFYDLIVVGGGPAGLGAAVYGASEGLRTLLVERVATGGQAGQSSRIENYLGFPDGVSGSQLTDRARRQAAKFGAEVLTACDAVGVEPCGATRLVKLADGRELAAHTVILATGVAYRVLDAPGLAGLTGRGVFYGAAITEGANCADQDVYVVGAANSAGQAAMYFSRYARKVVLLARGGSLDSSMSRYLIDQIARVPNIRVRTRSVLQCVEGAGRVERASLVNVDDGSAIAEPVDAVFVMIGARPHTGWLPPIVLRDRRGFVLTGRELVASPDVRRLWKEGRDPLPLETSVPGVFAAGDARAGAINRVASAVGEGAMAVKLVHEYLALT
jgi:thioredoxin reductase (NADPH)